MANSNHYNTLDVSPEATQAEIKQAYRRLVKQFHPDSNRELEDHEHITQINAAYEVLGDPGRRQTYDQQLYYGFPVEEYVGATSPSERQRRAAEAQRHYQQQRQTGQDTDEQLQQWLHWVYVPVNRIVGRILRSLADEVDQLAADPFDDELMEAFQIYLQNCREALSQAQLTFRSRPNPRNVAGVAAYLYHCLNQVGDGIEELERFTFNYDDYYLHTGQELFRIAAGLRREAQAAIKDIS
jgi:molecular chaperone DnaJ